MLKVKILAFLALVGGFIASLFKAFSMGKKAEKSKQTEAENKELHDFIERKSDAEQEADELVKNAESRGDDDRRDIDF